jgi:hypothetical protein
MKNKYKFKDIKIGYRIYFTCAVADVSAFLGASSDPLETYL